MFCRKCGFKASDNTEICPSCGTDFTKNEVINDFQIVSLWKSYTENRPVIKDDSDSLIKIFCRKCGFKMRDKADKCPCCGTFINAPVCEAVNDFDIIYCWKSETTEDYLKLE